MIVYPAIDLIGGACVRLRQGDFEQATRYDCSPFEALASFASAGAEWAHVVDLDGARDCRPRQHDLLALLAASTSLKLQAAGGVRTVEHVERLLEAGIERVVIGSLAITHPLTVTAMLDRFGGDRIAIALDIALDEGRPMVATHGWSRRSALNLYAVAERFPSARHILVTDIARDGMLAGPNLALMPELVARLPAMAIQASGGVASIDDLSALARTRVAGAIVGKALWEERFDLTEALAYAGA